MCLYTHTTPYLLPSLCSQKEGLRVEIYKGCYLFFGMLLLNKRHMGTKLVYLRGLFLCFWWGTMLCVDSTMRYPSSPNLVLILPRHVFIHVPPSSILPNFCSSVMCECIQVPLYDLITFVYSFFDQLIFFTLNFFRISNLSLLNIIYDSVKISLIFTLVNDEKC